MSTKVDTIRRHVMENVERIRPLGAISIKEVRKRFTEINRTVAEKGGAVIVTNRGNPSTAIVSMKLLRELMGDKAFKELLFKEFFLTQVEDRVNRFLDGKEGTISFEELKKKLGR
jgi:prevent-host-death family protein